MLKMAVSARALFNIDEGHQIFVDEGPGAFEEYMRGRQDEALPPGPAFSLVRKLLALNTAGRPAMIDVVLVSRNSAAAGTRVMRSIQHHGLSIEQCAFLHGRPRAAMLSALGVRLFLSRHSEEVREVLEQGIAAATLASQSPSRDGTDDVVRVAFDGDAVLFSDEAERIHHREGLEAFMASERDNARRPLGEGPFRSVLADLACVQENVGERVRIALVTARGSSCHGRVMETLNSWGLRVNESVFCSGAPKGPLLEALGVDIFVDDGLHNIESAARFVTCGHVPYGVSNLPAASSSVLQ